MQTFLRFFVDRRLLANLTVVALIVGGVLTGQQAQREGFPSITLNKVIVTATLPGAASHDVEYLAASFIRSARDVEDIRSQLTALGADIPIITKIESRRGVDNLDSIIAVADGIMVARGDLGVELALAQGPTIQKKIIRATVTNGKPVITATQVDQ